jgi:hypothetical protein
MSTPDQTQTPLYFMSYTPCIGAFRAMLTDALPSCTPCSSSAHRCSQILLPHAALRSSACHAHMDTSYTLLAVSTPCHARMYRCLRTPCTNLSCTCSVSWNTPHVAYNISQPPCHVVAAIRTSCGSYPRYRVNRMPHRIART